MPGGTLSKRLREASLVGTDVPLAPVLEATRLGERSGGASAASFLRAYHLVAWPAAAVLLWALAGLLAAALRAAPPYGLLAVGLVAIAVAAGLATRTPRASAFLVTLGLGLAAAGHLLHPRGASLAPIMPLGIAGPLAGVLLFLLGLAVVPVLAGWRVLALSLALRATGRKPRALPLRALDAADGDALARPAAAPWRGLLRAWAEGWLLPGGLALHAAGSLAHRIAGSETLHARWDRDSVKAALLAHGAAVEEKGAGLLVTLPQSGARARLRPARLGFPRGEPALEVRGAPPARLALRRALESDAAPALTLSWTDAGRRIEARLNSLLRDAATASTLEERSALYEDAQRIETILDERTLLHDDWVVLRAWKTHRARLALAQKLLSEPVGPRGEGRVVAPAPAMRPDLARVMDAGGLAALRRAVFVPHWIVAVRTPWGEREVLVNALTGKPDTEGGADVLAAARDRGATLLLDAPRSVRFLQAAEPTAAILRDLRAALPRGVDVVAAADAPVDWLFVPHVPSGDAYVNAVTGAPAADLGPAPGLASMA